jgi:hypothetical protein
MKLKGTKLYSIATFKCPVCHEGDFFVSHPYDLMRAGDVHARCPVCATKFEREPGFFYGAMYVSYALGVATFVTVWVAMSVLFPGVGVLGQSLAVLGALFISAPFSYALSKILWANFFFSHRGRKEGIAADPKAVSH